MNSIDVQLARDAFGRLVLTEPNGIRHVDVQPVRCYPITDPRHWISLCDREGRERLTIEDISQLAPESRAVLERELALREFVPTIQRIENVSAGADPTHWQVETDRGPARFLVKSEEDIRRLGPAGAIIVDTHGIRYVVPDIRQLDASSRRWLERYL